MRKLSLRLDSLHVETFYVTRSFDPPRGTVRANSEPWHSVGCNQSVVTLCGTCAGDLGCPPSKPANEDS